MTSDVMAELSVLLGEERDALLSGRIEEIEAIADRKQVLLDHFDAGDLNSAAGLSELRLSAHRNQDLLEASLSGLQSARTRLKEIRRASDQLDTYTDGGEVRNLLGAVRTIERRA